MKLTKFSAEDKTNLPRIARFLEDLKCIIDHQIENEKRSTITSAVTPERTRQATKRKITSNQNEQVLKKISIKKDKINNIISLCDNQNKKISEN